MNLDVCYDLSNHIPRQTARGTHGDGTRSKTPNGSGGQNPESHLPNFAGED